MENNKFIYQQASARLTVEGLPDYSLNHSNSSIGIVSNWSLELIGKPNLEGKLDHLKSLINVFYPYSRYCLSGIRRRFNDPNGFIEILPNEEACHNIKLRSSKPGISPLEITLDDAELSDLLRCIDALIKDERVVIKWEYPKDFPLRQKDITSEISLIPKLTSPILGLSIFALSTITLLAVPLPNTLIEVNENSAITNSNKDSID
tara:strand:- start:116 stop:730 length:615 start_codon:yes stop_codon:yes gene_type:complete